MNPKTVNRLSVNSYTIHELLGVNRRPALSPDGAEVVDTVERAAPQIDLLDVPQALAERDIGAIDLCYNHFPSTDDAYLDKLRGALVDAGVGLFCLLIDFGNLTQPDSTQREAELGYTSKWIQRAKLLGASCVRVQAGTAAPGDPRGFDLLFEQVVDGYRRLAHVAEEAGVRLLTENLGDFLRGASSLVQLLERLDGRIGLVTDFGNGRIPGDYTDLRRLLPHSESIHAKPGIDADGELLEDDFRTCVRLAEEAGFSGPYTLVYRGPQDPWEGLERTRDLVLSSIESSSGSASGIRPNG